MRDRMTDVGAGFLEKDVLDIGQDGGSEDRIQFVAHLFEQRRYRAILLCLRSVVHLGDVVAMALEYVPERRLQWRCQDVKPADEVALKETGEAEAVGHDEPSRDERALLQKKCEDFLG